MAAIGSREATPVLLALLDTADLREQKATRTALQKIWYEHPVVLDLESVEEWDSFWRERSALAPAAYRAATLKPLVAKGVEFEDE